jgi:hypothetical protein
MKISFFQDGELLGSQECIDIKEVLIPAFKEGAHDVYLKKRFTNSDELNWLVEQLEFKHPEVRLHLRAVSAPHSVAAYAKKQKQKISRQLLKNRIVEVDFGFYSLFYRGNAQCGHNNHDTATILQGEMHKKRPCIVVGTH